MLRGHKIALKGESLAGVGASVARCCSFAVVFLLTLLRTRVKVAADIQ
jgi:hypothetical protein